MNPRKAMGKSRCGNLHRKVLGSSHHLQAQLPAASKLEGRLENNSRRGPTRIEHIGREIQLLV